MGIFPFAGGKAISPDVPVVAHKIILELNCTVLTSFQVLVMHQKGVFLVRKKTHFTITIVVENLDPLLVWFVIVVELFLV
jgi:hypothetical protein